MLNVETLAAAGFASGWMLLWAAAGAIPILVHLLTRRRRRIVQWAAMDLLRQVMEREAQRVRIEQLLLLLLRVLILVTLAVALARPFLFRSSEAGAAATDRQPRLWVIALDTSYSMGYRQGGRTRFDLAKEQALELVEQATEGDAFSLFEIAEPSRAVIGRPTFDKQSVLDEIRRLRLVDTGGTVTDCLAQIIDHLRRAEEVEILPRDVQVVLLSDLGEDAWASCLRRPESQTLSTLASQASLRIIPFGSSLPVSNLAVQAIRTSVNRPVVGTSIDVMIEVQNHGSERVDRCPVRLDVDSRTVESKYVDLNAGESKSVAFSLTPASIGPLVLAARLPDDALSVDDQRFRVVQVRRKPRLLFLADQPGGARLLQASIAPEEMESYLQAGGTPGLAGPSRNLESMSPIDALAADFENWDIIFLCDLAAIDSDLLLRLERFVKRGGAVVCTLGPETSSEAWNRGQSAGPDLLGVRLLTPSAESSWSIDPLEYRSRLVQPFEGYPDAGLLTTPIFRYWRVEPSSSGYEQTDLAITNGDPLLIRNSMGRGVVASLLSAPQSGLGQEKISGASWNAIATWPSFVPLMQQLVAMVLDTDGSSYNLLAGQPIQDFSTATGPRATPVKVLMPDGSTSVVYAEESPSANSPEMVGLPPTDFPNRHRWQFTGTQRSGVYSARTEDDNLTSYAVNIDPIQSTLKQIDASKLPVTSVVSEQSIESMGAASIDAERQDGSDLGAAGTPSTTSQTSGGMARILLGMLLVLLLGESALGWFLGRRVG